MEKPRPITGGKLDHMLSQPENTIMTALSPEQSRGEDGKKKSLDNIDIHSISTLELHGIIEQMLSKIDKSNLPMLIKKIETLAEKMEKYPQSIYDFDAKMDLLEKYSSQINSSVERHVAKSNGHA